MLTCQSKADLLSTEVGFLDFVELCADRLSGELARDEANRLANQASVLVHLVMGHFKIDGRQGGGQRVRYVGGEEEELETGSWALERTVFREMETARNSNQELGGHAGHITVAESDGVSSERWR